MTKMPASRLALSAAIVAALAVSGCEVSDADSAPVTGLKPQAGPCPVVDATTGACAVILTHPDDNNDGTPDYFVPGTHPRFNPATSDLPLNTDLLFSGTLDGTATTAPTDPARIAINDLDGWSVTGAFDIMLSGSVKPSTINDGSNPATLPAQNIFLLPLRTLPGGDALDPADIDAGAPFSQAEIAATRFTARIVSLDGGTNNAIRITPTTPLKAKTKYLVVVTNSIRTPTDARITRSAPYDVLASEAPLANAALAPLRTAIYGWHQLASGYLMARNAQINSVFGSTLPTTDARVRSRLALTYTFTTTDPNAGMLAMAAPRAAIVQAAVAAGAPAANGIALATSLQAGNLLSTPKAAPVAVSAVTAVDLANLTGLAANVGDLYTGAITLPYYLANPLDSGFFTTGWTADSTLGTQLSAALGQTVPVADTDGTYNVTYRYPFAGKRNAGGVVKAPLQVTLPDPAFVSPNPAFGGNSCGAVQTAQSGYPVVIYVHGITSDRVSVAGLAHTLASNCIATVAIDLPMHGVPSSSAAFDLLNVENPDGDTAPIPFQTLYPGVAERHFNLKMGATGAPAPMAQDGTDGSGTLFINIAYSVNSRDNIRQGVMDLLNLNASLGSIAALDLDGVGGADFNLSRVYLVGISLGGVVGTAFADTNAKARAAEASVGFASNLNPLQGAVISASGGQLTRVLENSPSFSAQILPALAASGITVGTENFERFMYVVQSMVDPADPVNYAAGLGSSNLPLLLQEIVGGGSAAALGDNKVYVADKVIPNNAIVPLNAGGFTAPLAGTDPMVTLMGAVTGAPGTYTDAATPLLVKLTVGHHASLLRPNESGGTAPTTGENIATNELHTQVVSFVLTSGTGVRIGTGAGGLAANFIGN